jgi:hypothetical protein
MPEFVLRFHGRFVFVERTVAGAPALHALAVDMTFNRDVPSAAHRVLMAAPRAVVDELGTRPPDFTMLPSPAGALEATNPERLEQVVWELAGLDAALDPAGDPFGWKDDHALLFDMREALGDGARLRDDVLPGGRTGPVTASLQLSSGAAAAGQIVEQTSDFVRFALPLGEPVLRDRRLADYVDIRISTSEPSLVFRVRQRGAPGATGAIVVQADPDIPTVVTFTNLCARVSASPHDAEFAALYELFDAPDLVRNRLVPRVQPTLTGKVDCYSPVYFRA